MNQYGFVTAELTANTAKRVRIAGVYIQGKSREE